MANKTLSVNTELNNKKFNRELDETSKKIKKAQREQMLANKAAQKQMDALTGTIKGFGGAMLASLGLASGAFETFKKAMNATETSADNFQRGMMVLDSTINSFFITIQQGGMNSFIRGLKDVIDKAREAYDAIDNLGTFKTFQSVDLARNATSRAEQQKILRDSNASAEDKKRAAEELIRLQQQRNNLLKEESQLQLKAGRESVRKVLAQGGYNGVISDADIDRLMSVQGSQLNAEYYNKARAEIAKGTTRKRIGGGGSAGTIETTTYSAEASEILHSVEYILARAFAEGEAGIKEATQYFIGAESARTQSFTDERLDNRYLSSASKSIAGGASKSTSSNFIPDTYVVNKILFPDSLVADTEKELARKNIGLYTKIRIDDEPIEQEEIDTNIPQLSLPKTTDFSKYTDGLNGIANVMSNISSMTDNATASMLSWVSSTLSAIGMAIPAITALTIAKRKEADANAAAATTGAAASVASTPFVGWIMAGAAVASLVAAFASIPKFATGGIVGGASFVGDNVVARVNSGEMILNRAQQANLFKMLGSGGLMGGEVRLRLAGTDVVGVIRNNNKKFG